LVVAACGNGEEGLGKPSERDTEVVELGLLIKQRLAGTLKTGRTGTEGCLMKLGSRMVFNGQGEGDQELRFL
jgi:hypothetical protein